MRLPPTPQPRSTTCGVVWLPAGVTRGSASAYSILDEVKRGAPRRYAGSPHGAVDGGFTAALSQGEEAGSLPIVVAADLRGAEAAAAMDQGMRWGAGGFGH